MHACRKWAQQPARIVVFGEGGALVVAPRQQLLVQPDQHRRLARDDPQRVGQADLQVAFGDDRQLDADQPGHLFQHRPRGKHQMRRFERAALALLLHVDCANPAAAGVDTHDLAAHEPHPARPGRLEHRHAELLGAQPAGSPCVQHRHSFGREIGKVPADRASVGDDICPGERGVLGRWRVGARARLMKPRPPAALRLGRQGQLP